jgi:hypothetical protein
MQNNTRNGYIAPIETEYNGCVFRSRLEARWAVFFDALGIEWQYETESFMFTDMYNCRGYVPDFYLPTIHLHVEIKGDPGRLEEGYSKIQDMCFKTHTPAILFLGAPGDALGTLFGFVHNVVLTRLAGAFSKVENEPTLSYIGDKDTWIDGCFNSYPITDPLTLLHVCNYSTRDEIRTARQARFGSGVSRRRS